MARFLRFPKTLLAAALGAAFALAVPGAASADHWHSRRGGVWLPFPPPPIPFFFPRVVVHRHGPYCGHDRYERYGDRYDWRYDRHERRHDRRDERHERRYDRYRD